jgi:hypothetical protein
MRIGEAIALQYSDFISARGKLCDDAARMQVSVTKAYNSEFYRLWGTL